jgi:V/A-type H+-transporting ATPase subunit D
MAIKKIKLTRPELKRQRDRLERFKRFLPMLKLKQQQLQMALRKMLQERRDAQHQFSLAQQAFRPYQHVLADVAGLDVQGLARPEDVRRSWRNVAGVNLPVLDEIVFPQPRYSLFATPAWVDRALADLQTVNRREVQVQILEEAYQLMQRELTKISQRVNLFEKVMIPETQEIIRRIRIKLGDEMTAQVGRAKIAKGKLAETSQNVGAIEPQSEEMVEEAPL